jgi:Arc/MetJ family transcription regulator
MPDKYVSKEHNMRTTLSIKKGLLEEAKQLSGANTKRETIEIALEEFVRREKSRKLIGLEGKVDLSLTLSKLLKRRKKDVPYR